MFILTATQPQAFRLKQQKAYPNASIETFDAWCAKTFQQYFPDQHLLSAIQLETIWQNCVRQVSPEGVVSLESLARLAEEAWQLIQYWQIPFSRLTQSYSENMQWFLKVAKLFQAYCKKNHCIDEASALALLAEAGVCAPKDTKLYGFFALTPLQNAVLHDKNINDLSCLRRQASSQVLTEPVWMPAFTCMTVSPIYSDAFLQGERECANFLFEAFEEELEAALMWAADTQEKNPTQKIAVILPELAKYRGLIESTLNQLNLNKAALTLPPKLFEQGSVQSAILSLTEHFFPSFALENIARLLRNPFFNHADFEHAHFLLKLRALQLDKVDLDTLIQLAEPWSHLQAWLRALYQAPLKKSHTLEKWWVEWEALLEHLHFSLEDPHWKSLEEVFAQYIPWQEKFSAQGALAFLKRVAQRHYVDDPVTQAAPFQILGVVDALDQSFDQLWLIDAVKGKIPFQFSVNPFIDRKLQHEFGLWALNTSLQDVWGKETFTRLQASCQQLKISYSKECEGKMNMPAFEGEYSPYVSEKMQGVEVLRGNFNPVQIAPWRQTYIPGATGVVKSQRICSMQAFARYRLGVEEMPEPSLGLTPIERGLIVHRALQLIWQQLQSQENLLAMPSENLFQLVDKIIPLSLKSVPWLRRKLLPKALLDLEFTTLKNNLLEWLALEAMRPPFKVVAIEKESQVLFKGYQWRLRVDRMDALADGRLLLIDYKTGTVSPKNWQPDIFTEPQLPLYAVTHDAPIAGIAFAEVVTKNLRLTGIAEENIPLGKIGFLKGVEDWQNLLQQWRVALEKLVDDFVESDARLNPLEEALSCQRCGLQAFCRIFDQRTSA